MGAIDMAVAWIRAAAADPAVGYDQTMRWGQDYDCSSLVITAWEKAGVPVKEKGATYTGNMKSAFLACGFEDVTARVDRSTGGGLMTGDVLLNEVNHTAMVIAPGQIAEAAGNELGGITGGTTGDQTGQEVWERGYYNYPWNCVLRYDECGMQNGECGIAEDGAYTVQAGDSLWSIAERFLGSGSRWGELAARNGLTGTLIRPGLTLRLRDEEKPVTLTLPGLGTGSTGEAVRALQTLLTLRGFPCDADGEMGPATLDALGRFAASAGTEPGKTVTGALWMRLIGG